MDDDETKPTTTKPPADAMDAACQKHDRCYDGGEMLSCDKALIRRLEALGSDPSKWPVPPEFKEEYEYAELYRKLAIFYFKKQAAYLRSTDEMYDKLENGFPFSP